MDWDLWESSYDQDTLEESDYMQYGWNRDFYDVIEENALNEKSCIQVLRILIAKEDMEIFELEQNLESLQTELACTELEEWPELCCNVLREKIIGINATLRSLKSKSGDVSELQLLMPREPAEKIGDILKAIVKKHLLEKDKQPPVAISVNVQSDASENGTGHFESLEQKQLESDVTVKVEPGETVSSEESCSKETSSPDHQESKTNYPNIIKPAPTDTIDLSPVFLRRIVGSSDEEKNLVMTDSSETTRQFEVIDREPITEDEKVIQSKPLTHREGMSLKPTEYAIRPPSGNCFNFSKECVSVVQSLCRLDRKLNQSKGENMASANQDSTYTKDYPKGDQENERIDEPRNAIVEYVSLDDFIRTAIVNGRNPISETKLRTSRPTEDGDRDLDKKLVELKRKTTKKEGVRELKIGNATVKCQQACEPQVEPQKPAAVALYKSDLTFAPKMQNLMAKRTSQLETPSTIKPKVDESYYRDDFNNQHFNFNDLKPQSPTEKMKSQPDPQGIIKQQVVPLTKRKNNTSSHSTNKRLKSDTKKDNACLNEVVDKSSKKLVIPESFAKEHSTSLAIVKLPPASEKIPNFAEPLEHGSNGDSKALSSVPLHSDDSDLASMKVDGLKTVAKEMKLTGYSKLKKSELIDRIKAKREEMSKL